MSNSNNDGGSSLGIALLVMSCLSYMSSLSSSISSVMLSSAEPAPKSSEESLPSEISDFVVESEPEPEPEPASFSAETMSQTFEVEGEEEKKEEVKKETFKLLEDKDYGGSDLYHYHPNSDVPFTKERCLHDCSVDSKCKAVVFNGAMTKCWAKRMADHELPLHRNNTDRVAYVKKDTYEEAMKKYG
jgi:hypothetical protein